MKAFSLAAISVLLAVTATPAHALTAGELTAKSDSDEITYWSAGALDMYMFLHADRAKCAFDWWQQKDGVTTHYAAMKKYPDKLAAGILYVLIKRECGPN